MNTGVAMSGGVDSSAAACLLLEQGHKVAGFTMRHFDDETYGFGPDEGVEAAIRDAAAVCRQLGIAHHVVDVRDDFQRIVVGDFTSAYEHGRTPNPCCLCNPTIKWGAFLDVLVQRFGIEAMATGHYARLQKEGPQMRLLRGEEPSRDQSYMLWALTQAQLRRTLFPIAHCDKRAARAIAQRHGLHIAHKRDSQDICFVRDSYADIPGLRPQPEGEVRYTDGRVIGQHAGLHRYTIGQRRGLGIPWSSPLFVLDIDPENNVITVTDDPANLAATRFRIGQANWIAGQPPEVENLAMQVRYNSRPKPVAALTAVDGDYEITLRQPEQAITPGQSAVFFAGEEVLGGGIIRRWRP